MEGDIHQQIITIARSGWRDAYIRGYYTFREEVHFTTCLERADEGRAISCVGNEGFSCIYKGSVYDAQNYCFSHLKGIWGENVTVDLYVNCEP